MATVRMDLTVAILSHLTNRLEIEVTWAIGVMKHTDDEFKIIRYNSLDAAAFSLAELMAMKGPYGFQDMLRSMSFLIELEDLPEEAFNSAGSQLAHCCLSQYMFVIGKWENIANNPDNEAKYRVVQDHRDCTPDHCFGDIAERN